MGNRGVEHIARALAVNQVNPSQTSFLFDLTCLSLTKALTHLDLRNNDIGEEGMKFLADSLKVNHVRDSIELVFDHDHLSIVDIANVRHTEQ